MRKIDPAAVRADFAAEVDALSAYLNRARRALEGEAHEKRDLSRLASTTFLSLYVSFERFLLDLFLAYLNRSFARYQQWVERRLRQSIEEKFGHWTLSRTKFQAVRHVKVSDLETIVDPDGRNLTFRSAAHIKERARDWLNSAHIARINTLTEADERLIDTAKAIRDFIAHRSPSSKRTMNAALSTISRGAANHHLGRGTNQVQDVGAYLKTVRDGRRRIAIYGERLKAISMDM